MFPPKFEIFLILSNMLRFMVRMQKNKDQKISRKSFHTVLVGHILVPRKCSKLTSLVSCFQLPLLSQGFLIFMMYCVGNSEVRNALQRLRYKHFTTKYSVSNKTTSHTHFIEVKIVTYFLQYIFQFLMLSPVKQHSKYSKRFLQRRRHVYK